ncbi:MFS transporter [Rhodococcus sp. X156]|uniref:CynX/NimT family MFS transporter n=1 Tax=Rhodococcus sp. X156 TaxID=2499145 RepID=UPI000FDC7073|nr:MFS transporter [Rhodococcus sp. X156]
MTAVGQGSATQGPGTPGGGPAAAHPKPLWAGRVLVLLGIVLAAFTLRTAVTSITPLLDPIGDDLGFGPSVAGVLGMLPTLAFAVFGLLTPALVHRIGLEQVALVAMAMAAIGTFTRSLAGDTLVLLALSAVALGGMGIGNVVIPPLVKRYFPDRVGGLSTVYITVLQLGTVLPALVAVPLANASDWRVSTGSWTLVALAAAVPWTAVLLLERGRRGRDGTGDDGLPVVRAEGRAWRSPVGLGMAAMFGMTSLNTYAMFTWIPKILTEAGGSAELGGNMVGLFSALGLVGALTMPVLATRVANPYFIVVLCAAFFAVGYVGLYLAPMELPLLWVSLVGLGPSTFPLALTLINLRTRTPAGSAALSGFSQGVGYTVACLGPLLFGLLHEATGGWGLPFSMLGCAVAVLLVGGYVACKPRMLEDSWDRKAA